MGLLVFASFSIAVIHSLAPDHYLPFVAIGRLKGWNVGKTLVFSTLAGTLHVATSILVGTILIYAVNLLGIAKFIGLSPCVPLIPLILASNSSFELTAVVTTFALATVGVIPILTFLSYKAFSLKLHSREDLVAGLIIAIVGLITYLVEADEIARSVHRKTGQVEVGG